jgi:hypothetical protein
MDSYTKDTTNPNLLLTFEDYQVMISHLQYGIDSCRIFDHQNGVEDYVAKLMNGATLVELGNAMMLANLQSLLSRVCLYYELHKNYYRELLIMPEQREEAGYSEEEAIALYKEAVANILELRRVIKKVRA